MHRTPANTPSVEKPTQVVQLRAPGVPTGSERGGQV